MTTRYILGAVFLVAVFVIGTAFLQSLENPAAPQASSSQATSSSSAEGNSPQSYTMAQVAQHNEAASCWVAINGKVYDLTNWISQHPGGPEHILGICGTDGSAAFDAQHGGQSQPAQILQTFYIGDLSS